MPGREIIFVSKITYLKNRNACLEMRQAIYLWSIFYIILMRFTVTPL